MCVDYVASECTRIFMMIVWDGGFSQRFLKLALKDIFVFMYEGCSS